MSAGQDLTLGSEFARVTSKSLANHGKTLNAETRTFIERALLETNGRIYGDKGAAVRLGIPPGTLQSKMKKLEIDRKRFVKT